MDKHIENIYNISFEKSIEFGFEKEILLQAISKKNKKIYNLNLASEFIKFIPSQKSEFCVMREYSKCLAEIISPPYQEGEELIGLKRLNQYISFLEKELKSLVETNFPKIQKHYDVTISDIGSSSSNLYLNPDLTIVDDQNNATSLVLEEYKDFVRKYENINWHLENYKTEKMIGVYNHINSFHLTFHPTYSQSNPNIYLAALNLSVKLAEVYKKYDEGNKIIYRQGQAYKLKENIRDLFLKELSKHILPAGYAVFQYKKSSEQNEYFASLASTLVKTYKQKTLDKNFQAWSSPNVRPRLIGNTLPAVEIRFFGSNFSRNLKLKEMIEKIKDLNRINYQI